ncbi:MAG TPA: glycosyltransferase, partial [Terriglobales bacterium]
VRFLGLRDDVPRLLAASDLMVAPTRYEAYGLAVHEAWARELPALVSAAAGVAERCPPQLRAQLLLEDPEDATALATRLRAWHQNPGAFAEWMPELGRRLRAHSWDDMAAAIVNVDTPHLTWVAPYGRSAPWLRSPAAGARSAQGASELPRPADERETGP